MGVAWVHYDIGIVWDGTGFYFIFQIGAFDERGIFKYGELSTLSSTYNRDFLSATWVIGNNRNTTNNLEFQLSTLNSISGYIEVYSTNNCISTDSFYIDIIGDEVNLFIPSAFSPNNDGINDYWEVFYGKDVLIQKVEVYDRWGNKVFQSKGKPKWDGFYKEKKLSNGNYIYKINYEICDIPFFKSGEVLLLN